MASKPDMAKSQRALVAARAAGFGSTVAASAREHRVGERSVWSALRVLRSGRTDLITAVESGRMTVKVASKYASGKYAPPPSPLPAPVLERDWAWRGVLAGDATHSVERADALDLIHSLPDNSIDLMVTSPPYPFARDYGIDAVRSLDEWVEWMLGVVTASAPKVVGLICLNVVGPVVDYRYHPAPALLIAELHRRGFNLRPPLVYHRQGTPGKYGDWVRRDHEPVVCVSRPGPLP